MSALSRLKRRKRRRASRRSALARCLLRMNSERTYRSQTMNNEMLKTIDEDKLDGVAGGSDRADLLAEFVRTSVNRWEGFAAAGFDALSVFYKGAADLLRK
jgi:acyl-CoA reductase-like NAD-dependent aldehyde dehydrogenase